VTGYGASNESQQSVVALRADSLDYGRRDARIGSKKPVEPSQTIKAALAEPRVGSVGIEDPAGPNDVVSDDHRSGSRELQRPLQARVVLLVRVD
jgi:hypothetical protein